MKRLLVTIALTCVLSSSGLAGDIPSVGVAAPIAPTQTTTRLGDISTSGIADEISDAMLSAVLTVLSLLS
jgi:hypothetical protein